MKNDPQGAEIAFIRDLVGAQECSREQTCAIWRRATMLSCDVFRVLAHKLGLPEEEIYRRAAARTGFAFCHEVDAFLAEIPSGRQTTRVAHQRSVRGTVKGQEVLFIAPDCTGLLALDRRLGQHNPLRGQVCIVTPHALASALARANARALTRSARNTVTRGLPGGSAKDNMTLSARLALMGVLLGFALVSLSVPVVSNPIATAFVTVAFLAPSVFRLWAAFTLESNAPLVPQTLLADAELPRYAILIPLRDEAHMVPQIAGAMRALDYPAELLDIKFVVESRSRKTLAAVRPYLEDPRFDLVEVPASAPRTKPKALDYALPLVSSEHVVVYDAEDIPDPDQLRRAASLFALHPDLVCLQAELAIDNIDSRWLPRVFATEYAGHFGVLLPAVARAGLPMPLGGTSNHFRTHILRNAGAWDAYNVTEDADLGLRLARLGFACASMESVTREEAPVTVRAWLRQRCRWMKGWMQTLIVHNRHPLRLARAIGWKGFWAFEVFVGGMILSTILHGIFVVMIAGTLMLGLAGVAENTEWVYLHLLILLLGYCGAAAVSVRGLNRLGRPDLSWALVGLPQYWLLAGLATLRAAFELMVRPFHWSKTHHVGFLQRIPRPIGRARAQREETAYSGRPL